MKVAGYKIYRKKGTRYITTSNFIWGEKNKRGKEDKRNSERKNESEWMKK